MRLIKSIIQEKKKKKKMSSDENPCWDGYEMIGTKMKDGKEVPNCVPISKESVRPYLSKDLLDSGVKRMKEYNDSIYTLHINEKKSKNINKDSYEYQHESNKLVYSNSKILPDILNYLSNYLNNNSIQFNNIKKINNLNIEVITDNPNIEIILEKEISAWRDFEIGEIYAEFE